MAAAVVVPLATTLGACTSGGSPASPLPEPQYVVGESLSSPDIVLVDVQSGRSREVTVSHWGPAEFATDPADAQVYATGAYLDATTQRVGIISPAAPGLTDALSVGFCLGCLYRQIAVGASQSVFVSSALMQVTELDMTAPSQDRAFTIPAGAGDVALSPDGSVLFVDNADDVASGSTSGYVVSLVDTASGDVSGTVSLVGDPVTDLVPQSDTALLVGANFRSGSGLEQVSTAGPARTLVSFPSSMLCLTSAGPDHVVVLLGNGEAEYVSLTSDAVLRTWQIGRTAYCPSVDSGGNEAIFPDGSTLVTVDLSTTGLTYQTHVALPLYQIAALWGSRSRALAPRSS